VDGAYWAGLAAALERGDLRNGLSTAWPPLYPAVVAAMVRAARLLGRPIEPATLEACARAASVLTGTLLLVPLHALAQRLLSPRAAGVATLLAAFHPRLLQYSAAALSETTFTLFLVAGLALIVACEHEASSARSVLAREVAGAGALFGLSPTRRGRRDRSLAAMLWVAGSSGARPASQLLRPRLCRARSPRVRASMPALAIPRWQLPCG
jgi:hypothetical protein